MSTLSFAPSPDLEKNLHSLAYLSVTENYMDFIARMSWNPITTDDLDNPAKAEVEKINTLSEKTLKGAQAHAKAWSATAQGREAYRDQFVKIGDLLENFADNWINSISALGDITEPGARRELIAELRSYLTELQNGLLPIRSDLDQFARSISTDQKNFAREYAALKTGLSSLSDFFQKTEAQVKELQKQLDKKNEEIVQKAIKTSIDDLKDGILAISNAVDENYVGTAKQVLTMTYVTFKFGIEGIILDAEALVLLREIIHLNRELNQVDVAMMRLRDLGSQLDAIAGRKLDIVSLIDTSVAFVDGMKQQLDKLDQNGTATQANWNDTIAPWKTFRTAIGQVNDHPDRSVEVWKAGELVKA